MDAHPYDLEERTARFGEAVIDFARRVPRGPLTDRLIDQLVGAGTSVGANYCEADDAVSKRDFRHRIGTCNKEARKRPKTKDPRPKTKAIPPTNPATPPFAIRISSFLRHSSF